MFGINYGRTHGGGKFPVFILRGGKRLIILMAILRDFFFLNGGIFQIPVDSVTP
jgi:hypothetical protein